MVMVHQSLPAVRLCTKGMFWKLIARELPQACKALRFLLFDSGEALTNHLGVVLFWIS